MVANHLDRGRTDKPPKMPPIRTAIAITTLKSHDGFQRKGRNAQTSRNCVPNTTPCTKPSRVPATILPAMPPSVTAIATAAETTQCVQTPMEQSTATKAVSSKSDRRLN